MHEYYMCKDCRRIIDWEGSHPSTGATIWSCEELHCGETFCSDCFRIRYNNEYSNTDEFTRMVNFADVIYCPNCYQKYLEKLRKDLADVPFNPETETFEEWWYGFDKGVDKETIWHWFDKMYTKGVTALLYSEEGV